MVETILGTFVGILLIIDQKVQVDVRTKTVDIIPLYKTYLNLLTNAYRLIFSSFSFISCFFLGPRSLQVHRRNFGSRSP